MFRKFRRKLVAAWWAFKHVDDLTMLKWELRAEAKKRTTRIEKDGTKNKVGISHSAIQVEWWFSRYLKSLPLN